MQPHPLSHSTSVVLRPPRWKVLTAYFLGGLASVPFVLVAFGILGRDLVQSMAPLFVLMIFSLAYGVFASGRYICLEKDAFTVKERFSKSTKVSWSSVSEIGMATFPTFSRGNFFFNNYLGIRLHNAASSEDPLGYIKNREICGYDIIITHNFGLPLDDLITLFRSRSGLLASSTAPGTTIQTAIGN